MRILMTTDAVGGVWTFSRQLATTLLEQGHEIALVNIGPLPSDAQHDWCRSIASSHQGSFRYEYCRAPLEWMQDNELAYDGAESQLRAVAREFRPDLFLSSQYCFGALPLAVPTVIVAHSDVLSWAAACRNQALEPSPWLDRYIALVSHGVERADAVVAPTQWMLSALAANFTLPARARVIPNGRTLPSSSAPAKKLQAIAAGRFWDEAKNLRVLNDLETPLPVYVAGPTEFCGAQRTEAAGAPVLLGSQSEQDLLHLFRESAVYLCTSVYEPFGLAPLEAALCGCAVVANDIPSLREVWADGALFYRDVSSLNAILVDLHNPERLAAAQAKSLERATLYSAERMADRYVQLFENLLGVEAHGRSSAHAA